MYGTAVQVYQIGTVVLVRTCTIPVHSLEGHSLFPLGTFPRTGRNTGAQAGARAINLVEQRGKRLDPYSIFGGGFLEDQLSEKILFNELTAGQIVLVDVEGWDGEGAGEDAKFTFAGSRKPVGDAEPDLAQAGAAGAPSAAE